MAKSATAPRRIEFKTGRIIRRERKATSMAFNAVVKQMEREIRRKISTPYPPASTPGSHPHMRRPATGLRSQLRVLRKGVSIFVRVPQYGLYLEGGTSRMAARPFIRRNIHDRKKFWTKKINNEIRRRLGEKVVK